MKVVITYLLLILLSISFRFFILLINHYFNSPLLLTHDLKCCKLLTKVKVNLSPKQSLRGLSLSCRPITFAKNQLPFYSHQGTKSIISNQNHILTIQYIVPYGIYGQKLSNNNIIK